jgi:hypothetical protein
MTVARFMNYPFVPKSTSSLQFGDYWAIQREDSQFGFLAYLKSDGRGRTGFFAAALDHIQLDRILSPTGDCFEVLQFGVIPRIGLLHVKTFLETDSQIIGNISKRLPMATIREVYERKKTTVNVWGYRTPVKIVNEIEKP